MYMHCFNSVNLEPTEIVGNNKHKQLTLSEMALICSHHRIMKMIVSDKHLNDTDWTLIMGQLILHP